MDRGCLQRCLSSLKTAPQYALTCTNTNGAATELFHRVAGRSDRKTVVNVLVAYASGLWHWIG